MTKCKVIKDQVVLYEDQLLFVESVSSTLDQAIQEVKKYLETSDSHISFDSFMTEIECSEFEYSKCFLHLTSQSEREKESFHCPLVVTINDEFLIHDRDEIIQTLQEIIEYQQSEEYRQLNNNADPQQCYIDDLNLVLQS
jgi:hypothetical protein